MSGLLHSVLMSDPSVRYFSLNRQPVDVEALAVPPPPVGFLRAVGGAPVLEVNGFNIFNASAADIANVDVVIDTPHGTYLVAPITVNPLTFTSVGQVASLTPEQSLRFRLLSTSGPTARIEVAAMYTDFDTLERHEHELTDDWAEVIAGRDGELLAQAALSFYYAVFVAAGAPVTFDLRVRDVDGELYQIVQGDSFAAGTYSLSPNSSFWLAPGQVLEARKTSGAGILSFDVIPENYFF